MDLNKTAAPELTDDEQFEVAFNEASAPEPETPPATPEPVAATTPEPTSEPTPEPTAEPTPEPTPEPTETSFADELKAFRDELRKAVPPTPEPVVEPTPAPTPTELELTADERTQLDGYLKDWPEIAAAEDVRRKAAEFKLLGYVFDQVQQYVKPLKDTITQLQAQLEATDTDTHVAAITAAHADYDAVYDDVLKWVGEQSPARKKAFQTVVDEGTAEEVSDLISVFKEAKGLKPAGTVVNSTSPAAPPAANKAAERLKAVPSRRTAPTTAADPNDFDSAFEEFAKASAK